MAEWVGKAEDGHADARVPYHRTFYPAELEDFWCLNKECRQALGLAKTFTMPDGEERIHFDHKLVELEETCTWRTDDILRLRSGVDEMKHILYPLWADAHAEVGEAPSR